MKDLPSFLDAQQDEVPVTPRRVVNVLHRKPLAAANLFANVRPDGLTYREIPSLMGSQRKLPSGEVV